jgi:hypothetical protein
MCASRVSTLTDEYQGYLFLLQLFVNFENPLKHEREKDLSSFSLEIAQQQIKSYG